MKPLLRNHENEIKNPKITPILVVDSRSKTDSLEDKYFETLKT